MTHSVTDSHVIDAGGRLHWIEEDFRDIKTGDKFVITYGGRWSSPTTYSKPKRVTRHTDLTFWLEGDEEGKEVRVAKTNGKVHGNRYSSNYAKPYTDDETQS